MDPRSCPLRSCAPSEQQHSRAGEAQQKTVRQLAISAPRASAHSTRARVVAERSSTTPPAPTQAAATSNASASPRTAACSGRMFVQQLCNERRVI